MLTGLLQACSICSMSDGQTRSASNREARRTRGRDEYDSSQIHERRSGAGGWAVGKGKAVRGRNRRSLPSARKRQNPASQPRRPLRSPNSQPSGESIRPVPVSPPTLQSRRLFARPPLFPPGLAGVPVCCCRWAVVVRLISFTF